MFAHSHQDFNVNKKLDFEKNDKADVYSDKDDFNKLQDDEDGV